MSVSSDVPYLDSAYKLVEYAGQPKMKLSEGKLNLPGRKQVFRQPHHDVIGLQDEKMDGMPLLVKVMESGRRVDPSPDTIEAARLRFAESRKTIPARLLGLEPPVPLYPVDISAGLRAMHATLEHTLSKALTAQITATPR